MVFGRKQERSWPGILCVGLGTTGRDKLRGALAFDDAAQAAHFKLPRLLKQSVVQQLGQVGPTLLDCQRESSF